MKAIQRATIQAGPMRRIPLSPIPGEMGGVPVLRIDESRLTKEFLGFGVAITGSSCYELNTMPPKARQAFLADVYGPSGLNLSVGRLTIGSSDYSAELYSYDDVAGDEALRHFSVQRDEAYILPMIREILSVNGDMYLYAAPWSPPGWMKTGGSLCGGHMRDKYVACYATYLTKYVEAYAAHGVPVRALTAQNEPETDQGGKMPACVWSPDTEARLIIALAARLKEKGLDTDIWMLDHNFSIWRRVSWMLKEYPEIQALAKGAAFHYYTGNIEQTAALQDEYPNLEMHFTEGGPRLYENYATDVCKWGTMLAKALNQGYRSFTGWNLLLDETGGPNIGPFTCAGLATLNSVTGELTYSGQYKALKHFAPFVKRGARCARAWLSDNDRCMGSASAFTPVQACAAINPDGSDAVILVNANTAKRQVQLFRHGNWWYFELLPDSVSTICFEE